MARSPFAKSKVMVENMDALVQTMNKQNAPDESAFYDDEPAGPPRSGRRSKPPQTPVHVFRCVREPAL